MPKLVKSDWWAALGLAVFVAAGIMLATTDDGDSPAPEVSKSGQMAQEKPRLRDGYVLCESPGQLSSFMAPNVFDFLERPAPDSVRVHPDGHPSKKADMMVDGRFRTVTKGRKALSRGWCHKTSEVAAERIESVGSCSDLVPEIPNGGCVKVTVTIGDDRTWFTFGDAVVGRESGP